MITKLWNSSHGYTHYSRSDLYLRSRDTDTHVWMPDAISKLQDTSRSTDTHSTIQDHLIAETLNCGLPIVGLRCNHFLPCGFRALTTLTKKTLQGPSSIYERLSKAVTTSKDRDHLWLACSLVAVASVRNCLLLFCDFGPR